jgi:hypothetical protein
MTREEEEEEEEEVRRGLWRSVEAAAAAEVWEACWS